MIEQRELAKLEAEIRRLWKVHDNGVRRLREVEKEREDARTDASLLRHVLKEAEEALAARQAVAPEAYGAMLDLQAVLDHGGPTSEAERTALRSRIAKLEALVVAARRESVSHDGALREGRDD